VPVRENKLSKKRKEKGSQRPLGASKPSGKKLPSCVEKLFLLKERKAARRRLELGGATGGLSLCPASGWDEF
jgi:hypothetical protein